MKRVSILQKVLSLASIWQTLREVNVFTVHLINPESI